MQVEFLPPEPDESGAADDVLDTGGRRHRRLMNAVVAAVLVGGGVGWILQRPHSRPAPATTATSAPFSAPVEADALTGCPDTLACDANHQMQQHFIDLIKQAMARGSAATPAGHSAPLTHPARLGGIGRIFLVP